MLAISPSCPARKVFPGLKIVTTVTDNRDGGSSPQRLAPAFALLSSPVSWSGETVGNTGARHAWRSLPGNCPPNGLSNSWFGRTSIMTTARTRQSGTTAGPREGATAKPAGKANEAMIPVLIRLPRLGCGARAERGRLRSAKTKRGSARRSHCRRGPDLEPSLPVPDDARKTTDATAVGMPTGAAIQMHSLMPQTSPWLRFRFPRWAISAGIALGLVAVLMLAFSAIRGSSKNSDKVAEFEAAGSLPMAGIPAAEMPPIPLSMPALPPTPPPAPTAQTAAASEAVATAPTASASGVPGIAKQEHASRC